jgi:hypothetical protein
VYRSSDFTSCGRGFWKERLRRLGCPFWPAEAWQP